MTAANYFIVGENGIIAGGMGFPTTPRYDFPLSALWYIMFPEHSCFSKLSICVFLCLVALLIKILPAMLVFKLFLFFSLFLTASLLHFSSLYLTPLCISVPPSLPPFLLLAYSFSHAPYLTAFLSCSLTPSILTRFLCMSHFHSCTHFPFHSSFPLLSFNPYPPREPTFKTCLHPALDKEGISKKNQVPIPGFWHSPLFLPHLQHLKLRP